MESYNHHVMESYKHSSFGWGENQMTLFWVGGEPDDTLFEGGRPDASHLEKHVPHPHIGEKLPHAFPQVSQKKDLENVSHGFPQVSQKEDVRKRFSRHPVTIAWEMRGVCTPP